MGSDPRPADSADALFDLLAGPSAPYAGFGERVVASPAQLAELQAAGAAAQGRLASGFGCDFADAHAVPGQLDAVVKQMWGDGWSPETENVNLFTRDFGLALTAAILAAIGGEAVLPVERNRAHLSIWWRAARVEAFPMHNVAKCLLAPDGTSMDYFFRSLSSRLQEAW